MLIPILVSIVLIAINGLYVAAEFAIIGVRKTRISKLAKEGNKAAAVIYGVLDDPIKQDQYISTAQLGITLASLGLGMYAEEAIAGWLIGPAEHIFHLTESAAHGVAAAVALGILTFLHVVIGEMVPKSL
ncbi:MAG: CNNM domain-containing protein, partial [Chloroflexota bacterium]